jgi:hypothetical protein
MKYAKMYITRNHTSKIRLDLVSITSIIGFVDKPSATGSSAAGASVAGGAGGLVGGAGGFTGGAGGFAAGGLLDIVASGIVGGLGVVDSPCEGGVPADADISFYIILRYFFR